MGHIGGFLAGLALGLVLGFRFRAPLPVHRPSRWATAAFAGAVLVLASAAGAGIWHRIDCKARLEDRAILAEALLNLGRNDPRHSELINRLAWDVALDRDAPRALVLQARNIAALASAAEAKARPGGTLATAYADTLAALDFRLGHALAALQREIALPEQHAAVREHVGLFLDRVLRTDGVQVWGGDAASPPSLDLDGGTVRLTVPASMLEGARLYAVLRAEGRLLGLLQVQVPPGFKGSRTWPAPGIALPPGEKPTVVLGLIDRRGCRCPEPAPPHFTLAEPEENGPAWDGH